MPNPYFAFKQFTVFQSEAAMKVGTDGVLLGAWCNILPTPDVASWQILDVGCGTGVIALMAAQRVPKASIDAIEPDAGSCRDAGSNFDRSPWSDRLRLYRMTLQEFRATEPLKAGFYDRIVSNPPYFVDSLQSPDPLKNAARHTVCLPYADLLGGVNTLLSPKGIFSVILPLPEGIAFEQMALERHLYCVRRLQVQTIPGAAPKRVLMEFSRSEAPQQSDTLVMENDGRQGYSDAYQRLTRDFYLKF